MARSKIKAREIAHEAHSAALKTQRANVNAQRARQARIDAGRRSSASTGSEGGKDASGLHSIP
jgi:hypothetical protein